MLNRYLIQNPELVRNKKCIELGAGVGVTGILCALLGGDVTITDKAALMPLIKMNIEANTTSAHNVRALPIQWYPVIYDSPYLDRGTTEAALNPPYDVILINDVGFLDLEYFSLMDNRVQCARITLMHLS